MPRPNRICFPGAVYHIIQRGNRGQDIFLEDYDKWHLLKLFLEAKKKFACLFYCYALMSNHFHLTIETPSAVPISKIMQLAAGSYAVYFNKKYSRNGHLFQGRFKSILVEKEAYLVNLSRYVHLNPVKAGLAKMPEEYQWSSYRIYLGLRKDSLVNTMPILSYFGTQGGQNNPIAYKNFIEEGIPETVSTGKDWLDKNLTGKDFLCSREYIRQNKIV